MKKIWLDEAGLLDIPYICTYQHIFFNGIHNSIYKVVWVAIIIKCNANIWQLNATPLIPPPPNTKMYNIYKQHFTSRLEILCKHKCKMVNARGMVIWYHFMHAYIDILCWVKSYIWLCFIFYFRWSQTNLINNKRRRVYRIEHALDAIQQSDDS